MEVQLSVQPELKLPKAGAKGKEWTQTEDVHPSWFIKRTDKDESEANSTLISSDATQVIACSFKSLVKEQAKVGPTIHNFSMSLPFRVNILPILAGKEVILKLKPLPEKKKSKAPVSAFDQIALGDKRAR